jgi:uncharacterized protein (DUF924 family)
LSTRRDDILDFWFGDLSAPRYPSEERYRLWFGKSEQTDRLIEEGFGADLDRASTGEYESWEEDAPGRLALIVLFDQFSRSVYRDTAQAFAFDEHARALALEGLRRGVDHELHPFQRVFFYLPLEHAENLELQTKSVELYRRLLEAAPQYADKLSGYLDYAERHYEVIERFGRFPHRNRILKRESTLEELVYLNQPGTAF